jgi:hypothetical protein
MGVGARTIRVHTAIDRGQTRVGSSVCRLSDARDERDHFSPELALLTPPTTEDLARQRRRSV